jgi:hypothetical protein
MTEMIVPMPVSIGQEQLPQVQRGGCCAVTCVKRPISGRGTGAVPGMFQIKLEGRPRKYPGHGAAQHQESSAEW